MDYVDKKKRCILEHIGDITHKRDTPLAKHMELVHGGDTRNLSFQAVEPICPSLRGGDLDKRLLQKEIR